jgi:hypothetical protein
LALVLTASHIRAQQPEEQSVVQAINNQRADRGLGPLRWDPALARAALMHAQRMASEHQLSHQYPGEPSLALRAGQQGAHFRLIEENVAMGPSASALVTQWMNSTQHRNNILNPNVNAIGVGLAHHGGYVYGVADFSRQVTALDPRQVEQKVLGLLQQTGIRTLGATRDARQTCEMQRGSAGGSSPLFVMRWEGADLSRLPDILLKQIKSGQYHGAAVGACDSSRPGQGFTSYRVAVMLY